MGPRQRAARSHPHRPHRRGARRWRSAPTGTGWPPPASTRRCGCGTPTPSHGAPLTGHTAGVRGGVSPDGHRLASASVDTTVRLWDPPPASRSAPPLTGHTGGVRRVAVSPDGTGSPPPAATRRCGCGTPPPGSRPRHPHRPHRRGAGGGVQPRRAPGWPPPAPTARCGCGTPHRPADRRHPSPATPAAVRAVAVSPDGHRLASAGADAHGADLGTPTPASRSAPTLTGHTGAVRGVAVSPDGHRLASASVDATVRLWDPDTGQPIGATLTGHTGAVTACGVQPRRAPPRLRQRRRHGAGVEPRHRPADRRPPHRPHRLGEGVAFSPDGHRLATAGDDKTVRLRPALASPDMLCAKLTADMSRQQWHEWISSDPSIGYVELCPGLPIPADA